MIHSGAPCYRCSGHPMNRPAARATSAPRMVILPPACLSSATMRLKSSVPTSVDSSGIEAPPVASSRHSRMRGGYRAYSGCPNDESRSKPMVGTIAKPPLPAAIPLSSLPQTSNNIIQKELAFGREQSGTVTIPGARRARGIRPAGCKAEVGLRWWRQRHRTNAMEDPYGKTHRYPTRHSVLGFAAQ